MQMLCSYADTCINQLIIEAQMNQMFCAKVVKMHGLGENQLVAKSPTQLAFVSKR